MLVLTRRIGDDIIITIEGINKSQIKLGIAAPADVTISREEVYLKDQVGNV